eukprot:gb/GECG01008346.1/.p1 GENE.gb/GECG01008346.1/~~gb/GECG01008346.1/.p1  ORF type:complete len:1015 (+),score=119.70 gb/GECG01008346.1/:1-3045(+)
MSLEANQSTIQQVGSLLDKTLVAEAQTRRDAEKQLKSLVGKDNFIPILLHIVNIDESGSQSLPLQTRLSAATFLKNTVKQYWEKVENEPNYIPDQDRTMLKQRIVHLMCSLPPLLQNQLSEVVRHISDHDFPEAWPNLFEELKGKIDRQNLGIPVLKTVNAVCKRFRGAYDSDAIRVPLKAILDSFQEILLQLFQFVSSEVDSEKVKNDKDALSLHFEALRVMARIFYSLNWITIPEYFEDHMKEWMTEFQKFLQYANPLLEDPDEPNEPGPIESLQAAILQNIHLYNEKYDEEFAPYFRTFVEVTWTLLDKLSSHSLVDKPKYDELATVSLSFLASAVSNSMHRNLFQEPATLERIGQNIVIPNITLRESDEELFEDNPQEYLRKDIEGSDMHTRRRAAADLVKSLRQNFEADVTNLFLQSAQKMLQQYSANPTANWKAKDAALSLIAAVAVKGESKSIGVTSCSEQIDVVRIVREFVVPDLRQNPSGSSWSTPESIVKASCIRFITTFRNQLPGDAIGEVLPLLTEYLKVPVYVLYSYAAAAIERFLILKAHQPTENWSLRVPQEVVYSILQSALENALTRMITAGSGSSQSTGADQVIENEYVMRCVMRLLVVADQAIAAYASHVLNQLTTVLEKIATNPRNPTFNHFLFESLTLLIRGTCKASPGEAENFERLLLPPFNTILHQEIPEFVTYVFQVLAALLLSKPSAKGASPENQLSDGYKSLFPALVRPEMWTDRAKYPALVTLLIAYIKHAPEYITQNQHLGSVLGIFQKLISSVSSEEHGFRLLNSVFINIPAESLGGQNTEIFRILLQRMQTNTTVKFARQFIRSMSVAAVAQGGQAVVSAINNVQAGLFYKILEQVVHRNVKNIRGKFARKTIVLGLCNISTGVEELRGLETFQSTLIECAFLLLEGHVEVKQSEHDKSHEENLRAAEQADEEEQFSAQYSRLRYAVDPGHEAHPVDPDYFPQHDAVAVFRQTVQFVTSKTPKALELVVHSVGEDQRGQLNKYVG